MRFAYMLKSHSLALCSTFCVPSQDLPTFSQTTGFYILALVDSENESLRKWWSGAHGLFHENFINVYPLKVVNFLPLWHTALSSWSCYEHCTTKMGSLDIEPSHLTLGPSITFTCSTSNNTPHASVQPILPADCPNLFTKTVNSMRNAEQWRIYGSSQRADVLLQAQISRSVNNYGCCNLAFSFAPRSGHKWAKKSFFLCPQHLVACADPSTTSSIIVWVPRQSSLYLPAHALICLISAAVSHTARVDPDPMALHSAAASWKDFASVFK